MLSASNLNKRFGSLVVAEDISLSLPRGVRYALIGPNGAGKTTLINLITGLVAADSGAIRLGEEDVTALKPYQRVRKGLARTFQINTLFPHLTALESVSLAVLEREGHAHNWWRATSSRASTRNTGTSGSASCWWPWSCSCRTASWAA